MRVYSGEILEPLQPSRHAVIRDTELMGNQSAQVEWPGSWWGEESCFFHLAWYLLLGALTTEPNLSTYLFIHLSRINIKLNLNLQVIRYSGLTRLPLLFTWLYKGHTTSYISFKHWRWCEALILFKDGWQESFSLWCMSKCLFFLISLVEIVICWKFGEISELNPRMGVWKRVYLNCK